MEHGWKTSDTSRDGTFVFSTVCHAALSDRPAGSFQGGNQAEKLAGTATKSLGFFTK